MIRVVDSRADLDGFDRTRVVLEGPGHSREQVSESPAPVHRKSMVADFHFAPGDFSDGFCEVGSGALNAFPGSSRAKLNVWNR